MALITCRNAAEKKYPIRLRLARRAVLVLKLILKRSMKKRKIKRKKLNIQNRYIESRNMKNRKMRMGMRKSEKKDSGKKPYILYALLALLVVCVLLFVFLKQKPHDEDSQLAIAPTESGEAALETESIEATEQSDENNSEISSETESEVSSEEEDPVKKVNI